MAIVAPSPEQRKQLAQDLNAACVAGDLAAAYRILAALSVADQCEVALRSGFCTYGPRDRKSPSFHQAQVAQACAARVAGTALPRS